MTTKKDQPVGWVVVDFASGKLPFRGKLQWYSPADNVLPCEFPPSGSLWCIQNTDEVHPWPLPASVLARLKERHPTVDWSQVPVADTDEKPGRWVMESLAPVSDYRYRDQDGWHATLDRVSSPWLCLDDIQGFMQTDSWNSDDYRPVNLDDLPAPAVPEVEKLRAEVERLHAEVDFLRAQNAALRDRVSVLERVREAADRAYRQYSGRSGPVLVTMEVLGRLLDKATTAKQASQKDEETL